MNRKVVGVAAVTAALTLGLVGVAAATTPPPAQPKVTPIANSCDDAALKDLPLHTGFQSPTAVCVPTQFGAQSAQVNNPSLLITKFPITVRRGQDIKLKVSTRNLVRDRFLGAADGGYYLESATLTADGLTRGHFHTGCRQVGLPNTAPVSERLGNRFVATEDKKGGKTPDVVSVTVPGFDRPGVVQCMAWAGDGSHRIPMMSFANQMPAFDAVRIIVR